MKQVLNEVPGRSPLIIHYRHAPADEPVLIAVLDAAADELLDPEID
jgi:hypothetical protein